MVVVGGSLFIFLVKAGAVAVLVRGEREAGAIEQPPLHFDMIARASKFSAELYIDSARSLFPRYARLGFMLMAVYLVSGGILPGGRLRVRRARRSWRGADTRHDHRFRVLDHASSISSTC